MPPLCCYGKDCMGHVSTDNRAGDCSSLSLCMRPSPLQACRFSRAGNPLLLSLKPAGIHAKPPDLGEGVLSWSASDGSIENMLVKIQKPVLEPKARSCRGDARLKGRRLELWFSRASVTCVTLEKSPPLFGLQLCCCSVAIHPINSGKWIKTLLNV